VARGGGTQDSRVFAVNLDSIECNPAAERPGVSHMSRVLLSEERIGLRFVICTHSA
jgi:hypothetical protein